MPWSGVAPNQTYARTDGTRSGTTVWQEAEAATIDIIAPDHDTHDQDLTSAINGLLKKDGGNQPSAHLPMGGFRHTNVADGSALTHYATLSQLMLKSSYNITTVGGTGDVITLTSGLSLTAYTTGMRLSFVLGATNTGAVTVNLDSIGAKSVKNPDGTALDAADWITGRPVEIKYDGTNFVWLNQFLDIGTGDTVIRVAEIRTTPPGSPADGDYYIITGTPTGAWSSYSEHDLVLYTAASAAYTRITPQAGWLAYVIDEGTNYQFDGSTWVEWDNVTAPSTSTIKMAIWSDEKGSGTTGGVPVSGAWTTHALQTDLLNTISGASLSSNQITLPAGTYAVDATVAFYNTAAAARFKSTTGAANFVSTNFNSSAAGEVSISGSFTIATSEVFELQYYAGSGPTHGLGGPRALSGINEVYAIVRIVDLSSLQGPQGAAGEVDNAADGSAADPGIRFAAAATGLYRSSGNLGLAVGGTERVVVGSSTFTAKGQIDEPVGALTLANGANSDITLPASTFVRVTGPSGSFSVSGFASGRDGQRLQLFNSTAQNMTITNDATSTAANRILTLTGADVALTGTCVANFRYSSTDSRWILTGTQG